MRGWLFSLFMLGCAASAIAEPLSQRVFTDEVIAAFQKSGEANCVRRLDDGGFTFGRTESDCDSQNVFTDRTYGEYLKFPDTKTDIIERLVRIALESFSPNNSEKPFPSDYLERLVLILRPADYGLEMAGDNDFFSRPFAGALKAYIALDSADRLMVAPRAGFPDSGFTDDVLFALAEANTRARVGKLDYQFLSGAWMVAADSGLAPSLLALPKACATDTESYFALLIDGFNYVTAYASDASAVTDISNIARAGIDAGGLPSEPLLLCQNGQWSVKAPDSLN